jgi:uncharacterized protein (TIGR02453 family)
MTNNSIGFTPRSFELLEALAQNNDKQWFAQHRDEFQMQVRDPFAAFLEDLTERLSGTEIALQGSADTMFRQARDVRFSPDKRPYSVSVSGLLTPSGSKNEVGRLAYVELQADGGRIGGGMHQPTAKDLEPVRRRIIDEPDEFDRVLEVLNNADVVIEHTSAVQSMPRGFSEHAGHRHADVIRLKQLLAMRTIPKPAWIDDSAAEQATEAVLALQSLYEFIGSTRPDERGRMTSS